MQHNTKLPPAITFTPWQVTIIRCWSELDSAPEIANRLEISEHTLQTHLKRLRSKVNVSRTFGVYKYMVRNGDIAVGEQVTNQ